MYAEGIIDIFQQALAKNNLAVLNTKIIEFFLNIFKIKTKIQISSNLNINKKRSNKIVEICEKFKINNYLSSYGAKDYLEKDKNIFIEKKLMFFSTIMNIPLIINYIPHLNLLPLHLICCSVREKII